MNWESDSTGNAAISDALRSPPRAEIAAVLAGARARGVADALELLGIAAVLIDEGGFTLHVNDHAKRALGPQLWIDDGRLRAADADLDEALSNAIETALTDGAPARTGTNIAFASESRGIVAVKVLPIKVEHGDAFQLLRAVIVIEDQGPANKVRRDGLN